MRRGQSARFQYKATEEILWSKRETSELKKVRGNIAKIEREKTSVQKPETSSNWWNLYRVTIRA